MCPRWAASGERGEEEEGALLSLYHSEGTSIVGCVYVRFYDINTDSCQGITGHINP